MFFHSTHGAEGSEELLESAVTLHVTPLLAQLMVLQLACTWKATAAYLVTQTCGI